MFNKTNHDKCHIYIKNGSQCDRAIGFLLEMKPFIIHQNRILDKSGHLYPIKQFSEHLWRCINCISLHKTITVTLNIFMF